jgi:two-component system chemotaxis response regulator CheB
MLTADPGIRVVSKAADGGQALAMLREFAPAERPQVVLLDLEMPVMDGMTALPLLLAAAPGTAIIVASALSQRGAAATMAALRAGAVDYIPKPSSAAGGLQQGHFQAELIAKVKGWARMRRSRDVAVPGLTPPAIRQGTIMQRPRVIAIGASTGGPQALAALVARIGRPLNVPIVAVQHMPAGFTALLADHLGRVGPTNCAEARDGEALKPGRFYLAPGDRHLQVRESAGSLYAQLSDGPAENFCRPAVDPLLRSVAAACQGRVLAAILTGMGQDGLLGCRAVVDAGGQVLAQEEATSVVWGMPGAVARAGIASALLPVEEIAGRMVAAAGEHRAYG